MASSGIMAFSPMPILILIAAMAGVAVCQDYRNYTDWKAERDLRYTAEANATRRESKMAAINKAIELLQDLQNKTLAAGETEAQTYNTFACFCKDTMADKSQAITDGEGKKTGLEATIGQLETDRDNHDITIKDVFGAIKLIEKQLATRKARREQEHKLYMHNSADLEAAIQALEGALKALKHSQTITAIQLQAVQNTVREAALIADALGISARTDNITRFANVPTDNYAFQSGGIITILEGLESDFRAEKTDIASAENTSLTNYNTFKRNKEGELDNKKTDLKNERRDKASCQSDIIRNSQDLSIITATLLDDQEYLKELASMCNGKAETWDVRTQARQNEISAISSALVVLKDFASQRMSGAVIRFVQGGVSVHVARAMAQNEDDMEAVEAATEADEAAPSAPLAFLQQSSNHPKSFLASTKAGRPSDDGRQMVITLLRSRSKELKSTALTNLVAHLAEDPFAKIKILITELLERMLTQYHLEANHQSWCATSISAAEKKRQYGAEAVEELNGKMAELEVLRDQLLGELRTLAREIRDLNAARDDAGKIREAEHAENMFIIKDAKDCKVAVALAVDELHKFYKTQDKVGWDTDYDYDRSISFVQNSSNASIIPSSVPVTRQPRNDAPDTGFGVDETYVGEHGSARGVIGLLEVVESDFQRTQEETELAEKDAEQAHYDFMVETGKSLAEKGVARDRTNKQKNDVLTSLSGHESTLNEKVTNIENAIEELASLQQVCGQQMTYEERVGRRQQEIDSLKKALCIVEAYQEYGPDGVASSCV